MFECERGAVGIAPLKLPGRSGAVKVEANIYLSITQTLNINLTCSTNNEAEH